MKIIGSILILIASITTSYYYEREQKKQITACKFLEYIRCRIELFSLPLNRIYESYKEKDDYINALIHNEDVKVHSTVLKQELKDCFSQLGTGYKAEQIKNLDYSIMLIKKEISQSEKDYPQKIKVFRAIALFVGCSVAILLV